MNRQIPVLAAIAALIQLFSVPANQQPSPTEMFTKLRPELLSGVKDAWNYVDQNFAGFAYSPHNSCLAIGLFQALGVIRQAQAKSVQYGQPFNDRELGFTEGEFHRAYKFVGKWLASSLAEAERNPEALPECIDQLYFSRPDSIRPLIKHILQQAGLTPAEAGITPEEAKRWFGDNQTKGRTRAARVRLFLF